MNVEEIKIGAEGGILVGRAYRPGKEYARKGPLLILCHGIPRSNTSPGEKDSGKDVDGGYPALAERCTEEGFHCFHFNFRGTGESEGNFSLPGWGRDLIAVLDYWEKRDIYDSFYLWGFSAGAAVSTYVASTDQRVKAVALAACPAEFESLFTLKDLDGIIARFRTTGIIRDSHFPADPVAWLKGLHSVRPLSYVARISPRPLFIVHGTGDELIPYQHALKLFEQAGEPKRLLIISGAAHQLRKNREAVLECLEWFKKISPGKL